VRKRLIDLVRCGAIAAAACSATCTDGGAWSGNVGQADFNTFEREVYPVLMRDCGYSNCHGVEQRAFQVWGPGRSRLRTGSDDIRVDERQRTYARALSMLYTDGSRPLSESPLLAKPLEISAGGATHAGVDRYGRNVYRSRDDAGFQVLLHWAQGMPIAQQATAGATANAAGAGALNTNVTNVPAEAGGAADPLVQQIDPGGAA